jgi:hypothetical protein
MKKKINDVIYLRTEGVLITFKLVCPTWRRRPVTAARSTGDFFLAAGAEDPTVSPRGSGSDSSPASRPTSGRGRGESRASTGRKSSGPGEPVCVSLRGLVLQVATCQHGQARLATK